MGRILEELKRRNVTRVAMLYVVSAWLLLQVFDVLISIAQLPEWVGTTVLMIIVTGFPISLLIAWFFELTPEGIRRETGDTIHDPAGARRIDFIIIGVLAAAVLVLVVDNYVLSKPGVPQQPVGKLDPRSIAVLPFSNSSAATENADFFADGVHDDLLTKLAKLSGPKSDFPYFGQGILRYAEAISKLPRFAAFREDPGFQEVVDRYRSVQRRQIGIGN